MNTPYSKSWIRNIVKEVVLKEIFDVPVQNMMPKQKIAVDALIKRHFSIQSVSLVSGGTLVTLLRPKNAGITKREARVYPDGTINEPNVDIQRYLSFIDPPKGLKEKMTTRAELDAGVMKAVNVEGIHDVRPCDCGSGLDSEWELDGRGIPLVRACDKCRKKKLSRYRPEILRPYTQADVDEPIEPDQQEEQTGTSAVAGYSTPFAFKKRKNEMIGIDGRYQDDMASGVTAKTLAGLSENIDWIQMGISALEGILVLKVLSFLLKKARGSMNIRNYPISKRYINMSFSEAIREDPSFRNKQILLLVRKHIDEKVADGTIKTIGDFQRHIATLYQEVQAQIIEREKVEANQDELKEMTGTGAVAGYSTPFAFSRKNKEGSPRAIAATVGRKGHKTGYKVVKSISTESIK